MTKTFKQWLQEQPHIGKKGLSKLMRRETFLLAVSDIPQSCESKVEVVSESCVARKSDTCIWLRDGSKITIERGPGVRGSVRLRHEAQAVIRLNR